MRHETAQELDQLIESCTTSLFDAHNWSVRSCATAMRESMDRSIVASIGFSGDVLRGALLMSASQEAFRKSVPPEVTVPGTRDALFDWAGELLNQLLGRFKNQLGRYRVDVLASTPVVVFGQELSHVLGGPMYRRDYAFASQTGTVGVTLAMIVPEDFVLTISDETSGGIAEGEIELF